MEITTHFGLHSQTTQLQGHNDRWVPALQGPNTLILGSLDDIKKDDQAYSVEESERINQDANSELSMNDTNHISDHLCKAPLLVEEINK